LTRIDKNVKYTSGKFANFGQNLKLVEKTLKNREKLTESIERIFRIIGRYFRVEMAVLKL
jgi:hypothetical protein